MPTLFMLANDIAYRHVLPRLFAAAMTLSPYQSVAAVTDAF